MGNDDVIRLDTIEKRYPMGSETVNALNNISINVRRGEFVAVMGPSGSGKSTLMNIIGLLDRPDSGYYFLEDSEVSQLDDDMRSNVRNRMIGFIFQNFNLLPRATALRNVILPLTYRKIPETERLERALQSLDRVGLSKRTGHVPTQLSGGERQRVAIARALVGQPSVILADEPTGNLDSRTGEDILRILTDLVKQGQTLIMVTHDPNIAKLADRTVYMKDGGIV